MKTTKGPWWRFGGAGDGYGIASKDGEVIGQSFMNGLENEANARLIASAPDLLEACRHAAQSIHHPACKCKEDYAGQPERYCTCHVQKARAAVARAEGRGDA